MSAIAPEAISPWTRFTSATAPAGTSGEISPMPTAPDATSKIVSSPPLKLPSYDVKLFWHERFHDDPANRWLRGIFAELFSDLRN